MRNRLAGITAVLMASAAITALGAGHAAAQSSVPESQLETFLGLQQGDLDGLNNGPVMNGSAISQMITVSAGSTLSFDYNFLTNEPIVPPLYAVNPFAFVTTPDLQDFADNFSPLMNSSTSFAQETGYNTFTATFMTAGTYLLGIGVVNVTDNMYSSGLLLDNFMLTGGSIANAGFESSDFSGWSTLGSTSIVGSSFGSGPTEGTRQALLSTSVPEPSSMILMALGAVGAVFTCIRRSRKLAALEI